MRLVNHSFHISLVLLLAACGRSSVPEPADLAQIDVPAGSGELTVQHDDQILTFNHVKAVARPDDETGEHHILVVFSQRDVESEALTDPFDAFEPSRWSLANHPEEIRPIMTIEVDPENPDQPIECDTFAEPEWLQGSCGKFESSLNLTITEDSIRGTVSLLDFFAMKFEDRGWEAAGTFETTFVKVDKLEPVVGQRAIDSPQVERLEAISEATASGDLEAIKSHVTAEAFAELNEAIEAWGKEQVLQMMATMDDAFVNLDISDPKVQVMLYNAGKRSRLVLKKEEEGMTSSEINDFHWVDGQWLVSM